MDVKAMSRRALLLSLVVALVFDGSLADAQSDAAAFQRALQVPMIDGTSLAGIPLGATDTTAVGILGAPAAILNSSIAERALRYQFADTVTVDIHVRGGVIKAISVSIAEGD